MSKRITAIMIGLLLGLVLFAACGGGDTAPAGGQPAAQNGGAAAQDDGAAAPVADGDAVVISYWKSPHSDIEAELWEPIIASFESQNPGVVVDHLVVPWGEMIAQFTIAFAGGMPPDVSYMAEQFVVWADEDQLVDLTPKLPSNFRDIMVGWDYAYWNGNVYGVPFLTLASVMFYNVDMFEAAGLSAPTTWEELRSAAAALTGDGVYGFTPPLWGPFPHVVGTFLEQNGVSFLYPGTTTMGFNNPQGIASLQLLRDMMWEDRSIPFMDDFTLDEYGHLFADGRSAISMNQVQYKNDIRIRNPDLNFGIALSPAGPVSNANYGGVGIMVLASASSHQDAAFRFIEYTTFGGGANAYLAQLGFFSAFPEFNREMFEGDPVMEIAQAAVDTLWLWPVDPLFNPNVVPIMNLEIEAIWRGTKDVPTALSDMDAAIRAVFD